MKKFVLSRNDVEKRGSKTNKSHPFLPHRIKIKYAEYQIIRRIVR